MMMFYFSDHYYYPKTYLTVDSNGTRVIFSDLKEASEDVERRHTAIYKVQVIVAQCSISESVNHVQIFLSYNFTMQML